MKHKMMIKALSILLVLLTLLGSVSVAASAARDPWQAFAATLLQGDASPWQQVDAYWAVAKKVRSRAVKSPREIGDAVLRELVDRDIMTLDDLMSHNVITLLREFEGSNSIYELSQTRDEALLTLPGSVENIPNHLALTRRWDWNKFQRSDAEKLDAKELRGALKDWRDAIAMKNITKMDTHALDKRTLLIESARAALQAQNISAELLSHFGLPSFSQATELLQQIEMQKEIANYLPLAENISKPKNPKRLSDKRLRAELASVRESAEALTLLERTEPEIYASVAVQANVGPQAAENYVAALTQAMTTSDANALVAQIAKAIQGDGIYPAMTYAQQKYTFNAAGLSFEEILLLYEAVVLADAALTGKIGSQANFPNYDVAARLRTAHGITVAGAAAKAIAAIRASLKTVDARISADFSAVPAGSGWTSAAPGYNFDPALSELQALDAAGGALKSDLDRPSYERMPSAAAPQPVKIDPDLNPDTSANYITNPDWSISKGAAEPSVPPKPTAPAPLLPEQYFVSGVVNGTTYSVYADYLAAWTQAQNDYETALAIYQAALLNRAKWQFTQAAYTWIEDYETTDYPAVPNTATPPADNSAQQNDEYLLTWTYAEKYDYLNALQTRFRLELVYTMTKDTALQAPENAYRWLQCRWHDYETAPSDQNYYDFVTALNTYFAMLQRNSDGTYSNNGGAFVPNNVNSLLSANKAMQQQIEIIGSYGAFFHAYRLNLSASDFARYSNSDLIAELSATEAKLAQFVKYFPAEPVPAAWASYLDTLRQAMKARVFGNMDGLSGDAKSIAKQYNTSTLLPKPGSGFLYNFNNLELWESIENFITLMPSEQSQLALAQEVYAYLKGVLYNYETLHWELNAGKNAQYGSDWLPVRGLKDPIVLKAGQDEFQVEPQHIDTLIEKLDTLLNSNYFVQNAQIQGAPPALRLPELDADFVIRLGEMRSSTEPLVVEDPSTGISVTLPPLETSRDTARITNETSRTTAQRQWIQAYRADVLLYLMHTAFAAIQTDEAPSAAEFLGWILGQVLPGAQENIGNSVNKFTGAMAIEGVNKALEGVDLSAAVRPFFTELLSSAVNENLLSSKLPNTILGLYGVIAEALRPVFAGQLLQNPANPAIGLIPDTRFAALPGLDLTLGYVLEQITGKSRYRITVQDLADNPAFTDLFGSGNLSLPELFLGAELTPKDLLETCWPAEWPTDTPTLPANAPAYVSEIAQELSDIYNFLNTPREFLCWAK